MSLNKPLTMTISIRPASAADAALILHFIRELALYEKAEDQIEATAETIASSLFGLGSPSRALICGWNTSVN